MTFSTPTTLVRQVSKLGRAINREVTVVEFKNSDRQPESRAVKRNVSGTVQADVKSPRNQNST